MNTTILPFGCQRDSVVVFLNAAIAELPRLVIKLFGVQPKRSNLSVESIACPKKVHIIKPFALCLCCCNLFSRQPRKYVANVSFSAAA